MLATIVLAMLARAFRPIARLLPSIPPAVGEFGSARTAPFHPSIHNFGNVGPLGALHARLAWLATRAIDAAAYDGRNMREEVADALADVYEGSRILEVGCGAGTLTYELEQTGAFASIDAVDTSAEMIAIARSKVSDADFWVENAVDVGNRSADVAIACMLAHELPPVAHVELVDAMLNATYDSENGLVLILDIDPAYKPSLAMLMGEPYVLEYQRTIEDTLRSCADRRGVRCSTISVVEDHVRAWVMRRPRKRTKRTKRTKRRWRPGRQLPKK